MHKITKILLEELLNEGASKSTRYSSELGFICGLISPSKKPPILDKENYRKYFPKEFLKKNKSEKIYKDIEKFLFNENNYNTYTFDYYFMKARNGINNNIFKKYFTSTPEIDWAGGSNKSKDDTDAIDIDIVKSKDKNFGGFSIKDDGATLANLSLKALNLDEEDIKIKQEEILNLFKRIFLMIFFKDFTEDQFKIGNGFYNHSRKNVKFNLLDSVRTDLFDIPNNEFLSNKFAIRIGKDDYLTIINGTPVIKEIDTLNFSSNLEKIEYLDGVYETDTGIIKYFKFKPKYAVVFKSKTTVVVKGSKTVPKKDKTGTETKPFYFESNKKGLVTRSKAGMDVFGAYITSPFFKGNEENLKLTNRLYILLQKRISPIINKTLEENLARIVALGSKSYIYVNRNEMFFTPSKKELKLHIDTINFVESPSLVTGIKYKVYLENKEKMKNHNYFDLFIRYANRVFASDLTIRTQNYYLNDLVFLKLE